jgi:hypothetical protein
MDVDVSESSAIRFSGSPRPCDAAGEGAGSGG